MFFYESHGHAYTGFRDLDLVHLNIRQNRDFKL